MTFETLKVIFGMQCVIIAVLFLILEKITSDSSWIIGTIACLFIALYVGIFSNNDTKKKQSRRKK